MEHAALASSQRVDNHLDNSNFYRDVFFGTLFLYMKETGKYICL
jgi:hypothetical protein